MDRQEKTGSVCTLLQTLSAVIVVLGMMLASVLVAVPTAQAAATYEIGSSQAPVDKDATIITINGKPYTTGMKVNYGDSVKVQLHWSVPNGTVINEGDQFTYDLPKGITFETGKTYAIYGDDGVERGSFTVNGSRIVATYTRADTSGGSAGTNITAYVTVNGTIAESSTGDNNGGKANFEFPGIGDLEVNVNERHGLWAQKNGAISTSDPSVYDFVVEVHSTGSNKNVKLEDTMGDLLTLQPGTLKLYTDADCTQEYTGSWEHTDNADLKGFTANIDQMADGQALYARYSVKIDRQAVSDAVKNGKWDLVENKVKYYSDDVTNKKTTEQSIWLNGGWSVNKNGQANTSKDANGKESTVITWTITVNADPESAVPNATTIKDALGANLKAPTGAVKVVYTDVNWQQHEATLNWADLASGKAVLPSDNGKPYRQYVITYSTEVTKLPETGSGDKLTYKNDVTVTPGDGSGQLPGTGTVTIGTDAVDLSKKYVGDKNATKTLKWLTTFTAKDDLPAGKVLTDTLDDDGKDHKNDKNYVKPDWQVLDADVSNITIYTDKDRKTPYTGSVTKKIADDRKSFTITFNDAIAKGAKLYISYTSTVLGSAPASATFYNTARFVNKEATDSHKPVVDNMDKSNGPSWIDDGNGTPLSRNLMRWRLTVHDLAKDTQSVTITDTMSDNQRYVAGSMVVKDSKGSTYDGVTVTDNGDHTLTFVIAKGSKAFAKAQSGSLYIEYDTTFANFNEALKDPNNKQYKNEAVIHIDGEAQLPDFADIWTKPGDLVVKKGTYDKSTAPFINYTVTVNAGANTLNKGNALTLTDTLGAALDLRMDSVVISDARTKTDVAGATYAYDPTTKKITFTVPDARAITITYKAMVNLKPGQDFGSLGNNTIVLAGYDQNGGSSSTDQTGKVLEAQGGISYDLNSLQIYKYADGDTTKPLNGAQFKVEKLNVAMDANSSGWTSTGTAETVIDTLKSGTSGYTSTVGLRADTIYRVIETQAPEPKGEYSTSNATLYVVFPGNSEQGHNSAFYHGKTVDGTALTVAAAGNTTLQTYLWSVSNTSTKKGSFKLDKKDEQGHWLNGATFTLTKNGDSSFKQEQTTADGQSIEFTELVPGSYTLTETKAPDGYQPANPIAVTVTNAGAVIISGKTVSSNDGEHLTVTDRSDVTSIRARKVWNDGNNQDGKRQPARFQLQKSVGSGAWTNVGQEKVINESASGAQAMVEWTDLPVREGGKEVKYQVNEVNKNQNGYKTTSNETTENGVETTTFTNTYTPETVSVPVTKKWNDVNNVDNLRPGAVTVQLYANGVAVSGKTLTLNEANQWKGAFTNLPKYANGGLITYTVQETKVPDGYTASTSGSAIDKNGITITNTHYPTDTKIRVSKRDLGGAEIAGAQLEINGETDKGVKVTERWTSKAGKSHEVELEPGSYTLTETKAPTGYRVADPVKFTVVRNDDKTLSVKDADGNVINGNVIVMTDIYKPVNIKVSKVSLTNGVGEIAGATLTVTGTTLAGETINPITWGSTGKPREITLVPGTYTLHESEAPSGYQPARDITFTVNLDGTVTVGKDTAKDNTVVMTDELNTTNVTVSKVAVAGVAELAGAEFELTGTTFEGDDDPFSADAFQNLDGVTVSKDGRTLTWTSSKDGPRTFQLPNGTYKLHETKAPEGYDVIAKPIAFRVSDGKVTVGDMLSGGNLVRVEDAIKSYTAVSVTKRWEDNNDSDHLRDKVHVTAVLYANGKEMEGDAYHVALNKDNGWSHDWTGLDAKDSEGNEITYTVGEKTSGDNKDQYHVSIVKKPTANGYEFTLYNIHQPDAISLELVKDWDDADNQDGKRPQSIQVTVTGISERPKTNGTSGMEKYSETLINTVLRAPSDPNEHEWRWTLENLPKKNTYGNEYTYIVQETPVPGYNGYDDNGTCTLEGGCSTQFTSKKRTEETVRKSKSVEDPAETLYLKNTHTPETTAVTVNKVWDDAQNFNGQRPQSVTVWLLTSLWSQSNGWPEPQGDSCDPNNTELYGKSCAVLTEANKVKTDDDKTKSDAADDTGTDKDAADKDSAESAPAESDQANQSESADQSATTDQTNGSTEAGNVAAGDSDQSAAADATGTTGGTDTTGDSSATDTDSKADTSGKTDTTDQTATADTWTYTFKNLPKYRNGKLLRYSVTEEAVDNYTATFTDTTQYPSDSAPNGSTDGTDAGNGEATAQATTDEPESYSFTLSNRNVPDKTDLNVRKVWDDNDNAYQKRPGSIWVQLYEKKLGTTATAFTDAAGGAAGRAGTGTGTDGSSFSNTDVTGLTAVGDPVELTAQNNWAYTFAELHANKSYEVREVAKNSDGKFVPVSAIDGYQSPIITGDQTKGYTITNSVEPVMPETGGEGTVRIMLAGLLLVAMSGAFFTRKALATAGKRNKKGDIR